MEQTLSIQGIQYLVDVSGKRKAVVIDLDQWGELWEKFYGALMTEEECKTDVIDTLCGKYTDRLSSSEEFARRKQEEIELEEKKWRFFLIFDSCSSPKRGVNWEEPVEARMEKDTNC